MDDCHAAGGYVDFHKYEYDGGWSSTTKCVIEDCEGFEHIYNAGTDDESRWCDYNCKLSGGHLVEDCTGWGDTCFTSCSYGEDLEDCLYPESYSFNGTEYCDSYC